MAFDEEGLAVARYEGSPDSTDAEVAFTVKAAWRRVGLASTMLAVLEEAALERGIASRGHEQDLTNTGLPFRPDVAVALSGYT